MGLTSPRHIRYDVFPPVLAGLAHHEVNLKCLLREAHAAGRLAILPPLTLHPKHNFDRDRAWRWADYYDFATSRLVDLAGREHPLPIAAAAEKPAEPLVLRGGSPIPPASRDHPYVVRHLSDVIFHREVPGTSRPDFAIRLRPAACVLTLAGQALAHLASLAADGFVGVHVRRGDRLGEYPAELTEPPHIKRCLDRHGVARGGVVFLSSDERDPHFWAPLERCFQVVRYTDFPCLAALVAEPSPDNYALYQVEREILAHGRLRIETVPRGDARVHGTLVQETEFKRTSVKKMASSWRRAITAKVRGLPRRWRTAGKNGPKKPGGP